MRLDWQRRAVLLVAASPLILGVVLVFVAGREAEREKLLKEREIEGARQRLVEKIDGRARAMVSEAENRVLEAARKLRTGAESAQAATVLNGPLADIPLVSEVFLVDDKDQIFFIGAGPLYLLPGEKQRSRDIARSLENDERWRRAEAAEFRLSDYSQAAALYQELAAGTADPALDALLLNRLARCYAKSGQNRKAPAAHKRQLQ